MRAHFGRSLCVLLAATLVSPIALRATPAEAHGPCNVSADDSTADYTGTFNDGYPVKIRVLRPTGGASCPTKPAAGWPLVVHLHGLGANRCYNGMITRSEWAQWGYAVASFNARGMPRASLAGFNPPGVSGCDALDDAKDALDDPGTDSVGPRERQDVIDVINWVQDNYAPSGCTAPCADTNNVGVTGYSYGGGRSWMMAMPPTDSRIKAVAPQAGATFWSNVTNLTSDGAPTPTLRPQASGKVDHGPNMGWASHYRSDVLANSAEAVRYSYTKPGVAPPQSVIDWFNQRIFVDDDPVVDKAGDVTVPILIMTGWLDGYFGVNPPVDIEAYNKIPGTDKFLYLGTCGHSPDACMPNNEAKIQTVAHRFFDWYVRGDHGTPVGGPIFYLMPPPYLSPTNNPFTQDNWVETTTSVWPPTSATTTTYYLRDNGTLSTSAETLATSSKPIQNNLSYSMVTNACYSITYGAGEYQQYDSAPVTGNKKVIKVKADLILSSTTSRLQVYVDLFDVDSSGTEVRVWPAIGGQIAPTMRTGTAGTKYRFYFTPGGAAWTLADGHKFRIKVTSRYARSWQPEPQYGTNTLYHNSTDQSKIIFTLAA